ncbi:MAG: hypothetical protein ACM3VV_05785, partial [Deltaproteobacteria bacterium]
FFSIIKGSKCFAASPGSRNIFCISYNDNIYLKMAIWVYEEYIYLIFCIITNMQRNTISVGISFPIEILKKIDEERGDIPNINTNLYQFNLYFFIISVCSTTIRKKL